MAESNCQVSEFVAGSYAAWFTYAGDSTEFKLGDVSEGFELEVDFAVDEITTDAGGDSVLGGIYRGGNTFVNFTAMKFSLPTVRKLTYPFSDQPGKVGIIGCDVRTQAAVLKLKSLTQMTNQPLEYHFGIFDTADNTVRGGTVVDHNVPLRWALSSRLRTLPVRLRCFPFGNPTANDPAYWYSEIWA